MAAAAPDPKLDEYASLLLERSSRAPSELEIHRILKDLEGMIERADHEKAGKIFGLKAVCYLRLHQPERALDENRLALQRLRDPTEARATALNNQAVAYSQLGRHAEAATSSIEAVRIPEGHTSLNLANLAQALFHLGETDAALDVFGEALGIDDLRDPWRCLVMARQASSLGLDQEATELFARFLAHRSGTEMGDRSAVDVIRAASDGDRALEDFPPLEAAIRRRSAMTDELARLSSRAAGGEADDEAAVADILGVYEATRRLRDAAVARVLCKDDRAQT